MIRNSSSNVIVDFMPFCSTKVIIASIDYS